MFFNFRYYIYLLQLENFHLTRFMRASFRDSFSAPEKLRNKIDWTAKLSGVVALAEILTIVFSGAAGWLLTTLFSPAWVGWVIGVFLLLALNNFFFLPLAGASALLWPVDQIIRFVIQKRASKKLARLNNCTVIGITGSYGKTTMKQTLSTMLSDELNVVATEASHNTPVAIARAILQNVNEETDVFIVEMGAYGIGDIAQLCAIAQPDISVLTGINEAHRQRFGSLENTIQAKFEIVTEAAPQARVVLNADDESVLENYQRFIGDKEARFYSAKNNEKSMLNSYDKRFHEDGTGISFRLKRGDEKLGYVKVNHFGGYIIGNVIAGVSVAEILNIDPKSVLESAHKITPPKHRLQPIQRTSQDVLVIDDSYNGNPAGAHAAIDVLEIFIDRRTIYVTPGLVEMGEASKEVHEEIGEHLARVVDVVVLVQTSVTGWIKDGLRAGGFAGKVYTFETPQAMHQQINALLETRDVVLFQNDWPENYQ